MKFFLIGLAVCFAVSWLAQLIKACVLELVFRWKKKHASRSERWMYE